MNKDDTRSSRHPRVASRIVAFIHRRNRFRAADNRRADMSSPWQPEYAPAIRPANRAGIPAGAASLMCLSGTD